MDRDVLPPFVVFFVLLEEDIAEEEDDRPPRYDAVSDVKPLQLRAQQARADTCNTQCRLFMLACIAV